ncbi:MAG: MarR family transcriptional regulator [Acidimicrobiaceae bacterium]|nr:MarR family transcriptional regulator [Acidimicrobiaceae bacterium]
MSDLTSDELTAELLGSLGPSAGERKTRSAGGHTWSTALESLAPMVGERHRATFVVLVWAFRTGRQLEALLSDILLNEGLDTSEFTLLSALRLEDPPHRLAAGELADRLVQTTGGTTKTIRRLEDRGSIRRIADPDDKRRVLIELTSAGAELARSSLELVLDAFDLDIGEIDVAERTELGVRIARLSEELSERVRRR